jgi:hypothetical protein
MIDLIKAESTNGVLVICGGRVDAEIVDRLQNQFANNGNVEIVSQKGQASDLPSAYTEIVRVAENPPHNVLIDALAGTTLEVIVDAAGLSGTKGPLLITSEKMIDIPRRKQKVEDCYRAFGATNIVSLGKPWPTLVPPAPVLRAPDLKTALQSWIISKGLSPQTPPAPTSKPGNKGKNAKQHNLE